ncbi:hypothetical protein LRP49_10705 [Enterovibrio sp. ZSDZ35]|uniref:Uncharacterized protein n=1 Tax=Enterovibrio qingdaonensis TaxID=2899818 RepID=A0ABT5QM57_9GAMM|nr:hypothetical protein [Enterovibrio sp. ZSDZ35]MDD1781664.1 hypothetical protein [Enterovibrio sp. ZSDZ35]
MDTNTLIEVTVLPNNTLQLETLPNVQIGTDCPTITASTSVEVNSTSFSIFAQQEPDAFIVCKTYDVETERYFKQEAVISAKVPVANLHSFYFGGQPWLLSYHPDTEYVQFYQFDAEKVTITPITAIRLGKGFTTVQPLYYRNDVFFVAYNKDTGDVVKMQIVAPAHSALYAQTVWSATWAQGWTRFAFFRLGSENFFIKTNEKYHKVNIDHFMDSIALGSHPVLNEPAPEEMLSLSDVQTFYDVSQNPYFFTYQSNGAMTFNRFDGDCEGWQLALSSQQTANTTLCHTVQLKECTLILML